MKLKFYMMSALLSIGLMSGVANAAYFQIAPVPQANDGEVASVVGPDETITYSPFANVVSIWNSTDLLNQNPATIQTSITDQFGGSLTLVDNGDFGGGQLTSNPFNILAIHYGGPTGGNEVLFFFNTLMTAFDVEIAPHGVSNFRAFTGSGGTIPPIAGNQVPVPAAVWLFGSGLLGLLGAARKKSAAA
jgi:hypothetical protein